LENGDLKPQNPGVEANGSRIGVFARVNCLAARGVDGGARDNEKTTL